MLPLYYGLCGTGPSGLCEVTAHTTCSDRVSPWLLGSFSGHAWRGRCIDLVVQMPSDTHKHNTDTHIMSYCSHRANTGMLAHNLYHLHFQSQIYFYRFLCSFVFNETYCMWFTNLGRQLLLACSGGLNRLTRLKNWIGVFLMTEMYCLKLTWVFSRK